MLEDVAVLAAEFEADWFGMSGELPRFAVLAVTPAQLDRAARTHGLDPLPG